MSFIEEDSVPETPEEIAEAKRNCQETLEENEEMVESIKTILRENGFTPRNTVMVLVNADAPMGQEFAERLNSRNEIEEIRNQGLVPFVAGAFIREKFQKALDYLDHDAGQRLRNTQTSFVVAVVDFGVIEIFLA